MTVRWEPDFDDQAAPLTVRRLARALASCDRDEWLAWFASGATIEDPAGQAEPGEYWDSRIASARELDVTVVEAAGTGGSTCSCTGTITLRSADGSVRDIELVAVLEVDPVGRVTWIDASWEPAQVSRSVRSSQPISRR